LLELNSLSAKESHFFKMSQECNFRNLDSSLFPFERCSWTVNILVSYFGSPEFKSWPGGRLSWLRFFVDFLSTFRQMTRKNLKIGHEPFFSLPFQFIIHRSS